MDKTLMGDRNVEYGYVIDNLPYTNGERLFDLGCGVNASMSKIALERGYEVIAMDLQPIHRIYNPNFQFIRGDLFSAQARIEFDVILNVSSIEHFGLCRYGVQEYDADADLRGMGKLRDWMKGDGLMFLTIPVGVDDVHRPWHRIYGEERLPKLLEGYFTIDEQYWAKTDKDIYEEVDKEYAMSEVPVMRGERDILPERFYYALGAFTLRRKR